jgi:hypothetical protein
VLAVAAVGGRPFGSVFQWDGAAWEYRSPDTHMDLYMRCFRDGLDDPILANSVEWFGSIFARKIVMLEAFIEELSARVIRLRTGGAIYGGDKYLANGNADPQAPVGAKGFWLGANGELKAAKGIFSGHVEADSGYIGGVDINAASIQVNNKGYLPVGFIYFQLRGQPAPNTLFTGTWENISSQFAGLFFRVEGGNAAEFGNDQGMSVQSHRHNYGGGNQFVYASTDQSNGFAAVAPSSGQNTYTGYEGGTETRPVNTTIRVWKRTA